MNLKFALLRPIRLLLAFATAMLLISIIGEQFANGDNTTPFFGTPNPLNLPTAGGGNTLSGQALKFGDFTILGSTNAGKTLFIKLPTAQTLQMAITQTADAIGKMLDSKPAVTGAFADSKTKSKGGAIFTATL